MSPQSWSCGRPRAQTQGEQSQVRYKAVPKRMIVSIGFSQRNWKIIPARAKHKRNCECTNISKQFTNILRHGGCHEADGAVRWTHVVTLLEDAEDWNKEEWIAVLSRSSDKPRME